ncbi:hypothetical protein AeRB84_012009 [Aphanomyces euteiches]|nr:hypothetical protein AeRB84_012009 [Aphanomyces euteiches]
MFTGVEALNTLCNEVYDPKNFIPHGQIACVLTVFVTAIAIYMVTLGPTPGIYDLPNVFAIFNGCYTQLLNISDETSTLLSLPACLACIPGLLLSSSNIVASMSKESKLLPFDVHTRHATFHTAVPALACTCSILPFASSSSTSLTAP